LSRVQLQGDLPAAPCSFASCPRAKTSRRPAACSRPSARHRIAAHAGARPGASWCVRGERPRHGAARGSVRLRLRPRPAMAGRPHLAARAAPLWRLRHIQPGDGTPLDGIEGVRCPSRRRLWRPCGLTRPLRGPFPAAYGSAPPRWARGASAGRSLPSRQFRACGTPLSRRLQPSCLVPHPPGGGIGIGSRLAAARLARPASRRWHQGASALMSRVRSCS